MSSKIGDKTPAQIHNDLFFINNGNLGIDGTLRSLYSGVGTVTPIKISTTQLEADFGNGNLKRPIITSYKLKVKDIGDCSTVFTLNTADGNLQKVHILDHVGMSITTDLGSSDGFEFTLIVQNIGNKTITLPVSCTLSSSPSWSWSGAFQILKFVTYNGGTTWLVYEAATF